VFRFSIAVWQRNPKQKCKIVDHIPLAQFKGKIKFKGNQEDSVLTKYPIIELQLLPKQLALLLDRTGGLSY